jgi:hypothetical protein
VTKVLLVEDDDMIEAISSDRAEIGRSRMPKTSRRRMKAPRYRDHE